MLGLLVLPHCKEPTLVRLVISTNVPFAEGTRVGVYSARGPGVEDSSAQALQDAWGADGQVGTITVVPANGDEAPVYVRVVMGIGRDPDGCRLDATQKEGCIVARRKLSFLSGQSLAVPIRLHLACNGVLCTADSTCNSLGSCVSSSVDPSRCIEPGGCDVSGDSSFQPAPDAGTGGSPLLDATTDTGGPGGDAGSDGSFDAGTDARSDAGADAGTDAGSDAGTGGDSGTGGDGGTAGQVSPCNDVTFVDPEAAWPVAGGCASRGNASRLQGPHAPPNVRSISLAGDMPGDTSLIAGRIIGGNVLPVFVPAYGGARQVLVPLNGGNLSLGWSQQPTANAWYLSLGPDGTLYMASTAGFYALSAADGSPIGGWTTTGPGSGLLDILPVAGASRGLYYVMQTSGAAVCRRNAAAGNAWCVSQPSTSASFIAGLKGGDIGWAWAQSGRRGYRIAPSGSIVWGPVSGPLSQLPLSRFFATDDKFVYASAGGNLSFLNAQSVTDGANAWGVNSGAPASVSGQTLLSDGSLVLQNENPQGIVQYVMVDGSRTVASGPGLGSGGLVSDGSRWVYLAEVGGTLRGFPPPYSTQTWESNLGSSCGAPILAAGHIIVLCNKILYVVGP